MRAHLLINANPLGQDVVQLNNIVFFFEEWQFIKKNKRIRYIFSKEQMKQAKQVKQSLWS